MNALVIDDSRAMRMILGRMLRELGMEVAEAANGRLALDLLDEGLDPDLVLVDWNMPEMTGHRVRRSGAPAALPLDGADCHGHHRDRGPADRAGAGGRR